jgi:HrpA-like RNA helicase
LEPQLLLNAPGNTITQAKLSNATQTLVELGAIVEHIHDTCDTQSSVTNHSEDRMNTAPRHYTPTTLGRKLSTLPCDARNGKTLLAAYQLGCLKSAAVFIASLDSKTFIDKSRRHTVEFYRVKFGKKTDSDAALVINVYSEWKKVERIDRKEWCKVNGLSYATLNQLSGVADDLLASVNIPGFDTAIEPSGQKCQTCKTNIGMHTCVTDGSKELLHAAIVAGVGSNIAFRATPEGSESPMFLTGNKSSTFCGIHRSSLVSTPGEYIVYCSQMINQSGKQSLLTIATISIGTILLFSNWSKYFIGDGTVIVGRGIGFRCRQDTLLSLRKLRVAWEDSLVDGTSLGDKADKAELLAILKEILLLGYPQ